MKKIFTLLFFITAISTAKSQGIYFQAQVKISASGTSLEFYIKPNATGPNINLKFDNLDFFVRWPSTETAPITGTPVVNTIDFPGLTILQQAFGDDPYGLESGFVIREWTSPSANSTNALVTYVAGQEYLVFSVPVSNIISNNIEMAGNNEVGLPYFFSITKNTAGVGGQSDFTSHNTTNGDNNNQLFYGDAAFLTRTAQNFYQKLTMGILPIKFIAFDAVKENDDAILKWTVESENATVDNYEIERSMDGNKFKKIATIFKQGTSIGFNTYTMVDKNITSLLPSAVIYYRIKQNDLNNHSVFSKIKKVTISKKQLVLSVYPNPVKSIATIGIISPTPMKINFTILTINGKTLQTNRLQIIKGLNTKNITLNNYATGTYILKVMMGSYVQAIKIIKE